MKILIADDHAVFRHGLKDILIRHFPDASFGEAETAQAALKLAWKRSWDIMLLDVSMPGRSGLEVLKEVKHARPKLPVLILSAYPEDQYALRVLQAGAAGYLTKITATAELIQAVEKALAGQAYIPPTITGALLDHLRPGAERPAHEKLSNREYEILRLIASGKAAKTIALEFSLSAQTISTHRARMLKKLGLQSTAELIRYAIQNRLVD